MSFPPASRGSLVADSARGFAVCCYVLRTALAVQTRGSLVRRARREPPPALGDHSSLTLRARRKDKAYFIANVSFHPFSKLNIQKHD